MHAVACFLFDYENEMELSDIVDVAEESIVGYLGDEPGISWKLEQLIIQSGAYLVSEGNMKLSTAQSPRSWTVADAVDFATQIVAGDLELFNANVWDNGKVNPGNAKIDSMKRADLLMEIHSHVSFWLVKQYANLKPVTDLDRVDDYKRFKKVQSFEYLRLAHYAPFSVYGGLYEHRAFDVRIDKKNELGALTGVALIDFQS